MDKKYGQFQIIILDANTESHSYTLPGPWGSDITSCVPTEPITSSYGAGFSSKILPRPNERTVDPKTLKSPRQ